MRAFFDTDVLIYLFDADAPQKQGAARALLEREANAGRVTLSTQVLQEFFVTVTRKLDVPLPGADAERAVRRFAEFSLVQVDAPLILAAIDASRRYQLSFWDAMIVQAALQAGASVLYSEDMQDGRAFESMMVRNPFAALASER